MSGDDHDGTTQRDGCTCGGISACLTCQDADAGLRYVPRCQHVSPTPWGLAQCALDLDHEERHAYSPSEALDDDAEASR